MVAETKPMNAFVAEIEMNHVMAKCSYVEGSAAAGAETVYIVLAGTGNGKAALGT
jgi:hypothetical protein